MGIDIYSIWVYTYIIKETEETEMKNLAYFEKQARELRESNIDYKLIKESDLILNLMKSYRKENGIAWNEYKKVYDKWFNKYH